MSNDGYQRLAVAARKDIRRNTLIIVLLSAMVVIAIGIGWLETALSRNYWREDANKWQNEYIGLYDEATQKTGEEPNAPSPDQIAKNSPTMGEPGKNGTDGAPGKNGLDGSPGVTGINGEPGIDGVDGAPGTQGLDGAKGADGRGIASAVCSDNGHWQITYTDNSVSDAGNCLMTPTPTPTNN